jgi:hypothetical protein
VASRQSDSGLCRAVRTQLVDHSGAKPSRRPGQSQSGAVDRVVGMLAQDARQGSRRSAAPPGSLARKTSPLTVAPPGSTRFGSPLGLSRVHGSSRSLPSRSPICRGRAENLLRHTVYVGLPMDKLATDARRETACRYPNWGSGRSRLVDKPLRFANFLAILMHALNHNLPLLRHKKPKTLDQRVGRGRFPNENHNVRFISVRNCRSAHR